MAEQQYINNRNAQLNLSGFGRGGVRPVVPPSTFRHQPYPNPNNFGLSSSGRVFGLSSSGHRGALGRSGAGVAGDLTTTVPQNTPMKGIMPRVSLGLSARGGRGGFGLSGPAITRAPEPCSGPGIGQVVESNGNYGKPKLENNGALRSGANGQAHRQQNGGHAEPSNEKQLDSSASCPNCIRHAKITQLITDVSRGLQDLSKAFQEMQEHNHQ